MAPEPKTFKPMTLILHMVLSTGDVMAFNVLSCTTINIFLSSPVEVVAECLSFPSLEDLRFNFVWVNCAPCFYCRSNAPYLQECSTSDCLDWEPKLKLLGGTEMNKWNKTSVNKHCLIIMAYIGPQ